MCSGPVGHPGGLLPQRRPPERGKRTVEAVAQQLLEARELAVVAARAPVRLVLLEPRLLPLLIRVVPLADEVHQVAAAV